MTFALKVGQVVADGTFGLLQIVSITVSTFLFYFVFNSGEL